MNISILSGRLCTVPQISLIQLEGKMLQSCKFVIAVCDGVFDYKDEPEYEENKVDFFQCIAFEDAARMINENFVKGSKINCVGKVKNHKFEDVNGTKHFTNILLVQQAEFGDTESVMNKFNGKKKSPEMSIVSDLKELELLFESVCEKGFLCIDESDYYKIAMSYM